MKRKSNRKMKTAALLACLLTAAVFGASGLQASEIDDLKSQMEALKRDYQTKIDSLQSQINDLSRTQEEKVAQIEEKMEENLIDAEYVGRYDGPFEKGGLIISSPSGFGNVSLGGYMDHEWEDFENTNSTFDQHRWILNVGAELTDRLLFYSEYEIEHGGPDAPNSGDGEAKVEQAWTAYLINDWFNLKGGIVLAPFGRYNIYHDSDLQDLTDRPMVDRDIIPTTWTPSGAGFFGEVNPAIGDYEDLVISYEGYVANGLDAGFTETGMGSGKGSLSSDNNNGKGLIGRVQISPALGHEVGFSGYWGKYDDQGEDIVGGAIDWYSVWEPVEFVGEYAHFDVDQIKTGTVKPDYYKGFYAQMNYHFWFDFLNETFLGRDFDDPTFTLVGRYGWVKIDDGADADTLDNEEERWTLGLNYRPVESWVFKTEYQWNDTDAATLERGDNNGFMASVAMGF